MDILCANEVTKQFRNNKVLNRVSFGLSAGRIYALVGNNGSGKTTLFRTIMGLSFPTQGTVSLFGSNTARETERARSRIGALIENPILYYNTSGYQNLNYTRILKSTAKKDAIDDALQRFNLADKKHDSVRHYSLGMKQRLALACALLGDPELLLLDEPLNGLDPIGMREIETTLLRANRDNGTTILISSHYLRQLYGFASDYIFIDKGRIVGTTSNADLEKKCDKCIYLSISEQERTIALNVLSRVLSNEIRLLDHGEICIYGFQENMDVIGNALSRERITIEKLRTTGINLEDYFIQMTGGNK